MAVSNSIVSKSFNPYMRQDYLRVTITSSHLSVEALVPEEFSENISSQYDTIFPDGAGETIQKAFAFTGAMGGSAKFDTPQKWMSTEMREFNITLHLIAYHDARSEVFAKAKSLLALAAPGGDWRVPVVNRQHLTAPPRCRLQVGNVVDVYGFIRDVTVNWKAPFDKDGYSMYAEVEVQFVEELTPTSHSVMGPGLRSTGTEASSPVQMVKENPQGQPPVASKATPKMNTPDDPLRRYKYSYRG